MSQASSSNAGNVQQLLQTAKKDGLLSPQSLQAINIVNPGAQIQAALGVNVDDVQASEVVLVTMMPDDSGSIADGNNAQLVRDGHNEVLRALNKAKQKNGILTHCRYLNGEILYPYCALDQAVEMTPTNYNPNKGTPLYDQTMVLLTTVMTKAQEFNDNGVPVRTVTLLITDGADVHSRSVNPQQIQSVIKDMLKAETHIIAAMGITDGHTDFKKIFLEMGIPEKWILTPANNEKEIRKAFLLFSQSAVQASQNAASFSKTAMGGFTN